MAKAKFDIKTEATRTIYAGAGVADLAVEAVRDYVADVQARFVGVQQDVQTRVQKQVSDIDLKPAALRDQALTVVGSRVEALTEDAKARRAAIEARVSELQAEAKALPTRVQTVVDDNVTAVATAYVDLAERGQKLVLRVRRQESTQQAEAAASSTVSKAKTTATQAKKAGSATAEQTQKSASATTKQATASARKTADAAKESATKTADTAKKSATTTRKTAAKKTAPAKSSAKATATTAKKTATASAKAAGDAAAKVGD